jgi:replicative superfamily II helicase
MTKEQLREELQIAYAERQQLEEMFNLVEEDFTDAIIYKLKANQCMIKALKKRLEDMALMELLKDIKKETSCRQTNMVSVS